jgi:O-antigen/teichoic acid export membrane protein
MRLRSALLLNYGASYLSQVLGLAVVVLLARLLTAEEIGVNSVATVALMIVFEIKTFGASQYIIQTKELDAGSAQSVLGLTVLTTCIAAATMLVAAPFASDFYRHDGVGEILNVMALGVLLTPFTSVISSTLVRDMRFDKSLLITITDTIVQSLSIIALAFIGFGYMSMVYGMLLGICAGLLVALSVRPDWLPLIPRFRGMRPVISFGAMTSAGGMFRRLSEGAPDLLLGRLASMEAVGYYSRAAGLISIFNRGVLHGIRPVLLPHFSTNLRERDTMADAYLSVVSHITVLAWPFFSMLFLFAPLIVSIMYGDGWAPSIPIVYVLCLWGALDAVFCFSTEALLASGKPSYIVAKEVLGLVCRALGILAVFHFGLPAVAWAVVAATAVEMLAVHRWLDAKTGIDARGIAKACAHSAIVTVIAVIPPGAAVLMLGKENRSSVATLLVASLAVSVLWIATVFALRHPLSASLLDISNRFRPGKKG